MPADQETERPGNQQTRGPKDQRTEGPGDLRTRGPSQDYFLVDTVLVFNGSCSFFFLIKFFFDPDAFLLAVSGGIIVLRCLLPSKLLPREHWEVAALD